MTFDNWIVLGAARRQAATPANEAARASILEDGMTEKRMAEWFFMRPGFDTFLLEPEKHARYVFGDRDREQRDHLLESLEEAAYSHDGYKAAVFGDYGRGKTHQCHNLIHEI